MSHECTGRGLLGTTGTDAARRSDCTILLCRKSAFHSGMRPGRRVPPGAGQLCS